MGKKSKKKNVLVLDSSADVSDETSKQESESTDSKKKKEAMSKILNDRFKTRTIPKADEGMRDGDLSSEGLQEFYRKARVQEYVKLEGPKFIHFNFDELLDDFRRYEDDRGENEIIRRLSYAEISKQSFINNINLAVRYINYFIEYFDDDDELMMSYLYLMKQIHMLQLTNLDVDTFVDSIYATIASDSMVEKVIRMVEYNTDDSMIQKTGKKFDESVQLTMEHLKAIMGISCFHKFIIPIASHYYTIRKQELLKEGWTDKAVYQRIFLSVIPLFDDYYDISLYGKLYHTATTRVGRTENQDRPMWNRRYRFGVTPVSAANKLMLSYLNEISQKAVFNRSAIIFIHTCFDRAVHNELVHQDKYDMSDLSMEPSDNINETVSRFDRLQMERTFNSERDKIRAHCSNIDMLMRLGFEVGLDFQKLHEPDGSKTSKLIQDEYNYYLENIKLPFNNTQMYLMQIYYTAKTKSSDDFKMMKVPDLIQLIMVMKRDLESRNYSYLPFFISSEIVVSAGGYTPKRTEDLFTKHPSFQDFKDEYKDSFELLNIKKICGELRTILSYPIIIVDYLHTNYRERKANPVDVVVADEFIRFLMLY